MSALAVILQKYGYSVSGSDQKENVILNLSMSSKIKLDCKKINATIEDIDIPWPTKLKPLHK